jgi:hypothetical protein
LYFRVQCPCRKNDKYIVGIHRQCCNQGNGSINAGCPQQFIIRAVAQQVN